MFILELIAGFSVIADEATIYVRSTILDRIKIGQGATVGAGSVVLRNVKEGVSVFGNPAKKIEF
jgi:serine acetyltransferase